jgi:hypothetical protein
MHAARHKIGTCRCLFERRAVAGRREGHLSWGARARTVLTEDSTAGHGIEFYPAGLGFQRAVSTLGALKSQHGGHGLDYDTTLETTRGFQPSASPDT